MRMEILYSDGDEARVANQRASPLLFFRKLQPRASELLMNIHAGVRVRLPNAQTSLRLD